MYYTHTETRKWERWGDDQWYFSINHFFWYLLCRELECMVYLFVFIFIDFISVSRSFLRLVQCIWLCTAHCAAEYYRNFNCIFIEWNKSFCVCTHIKCVILLVERYETALEYAAQNPSTYELDIYRGFVGHSMGFEYIVSGVHFNCLRLSWGCHLLNDTFTLNSMAKYGTMTAAKFKQIDSSHFINKKNEIFTNK